MAYQKFRKKQRAEGQSLEVNSWRSPSGLRPPNLQKLVIEFGTYDRVTPETWGRFETDMTIWKDHLRHGDLASIRRSPAR